MCVTLKVEPTVSFWQVRWLVTVGPVLGGVAVPPGVLPPGSLNAAVLIGRVQTTVSAPRSPGGVRVRQRLLAETPLKDGPENTILCFN